MICYTFIFGPEPENQIVFHILEDSNTTVETGEEPVEDWLAFDTFRCDPCEIPAGSRTTCPAAIAMKPVVELFRRHVSFEKVDLIVEMHGVKLESVLPLQIAIRSLLGLVLAFSDCPVLKRFRPLAHFHLPFGDKEHNTFRVLGMFLIGQYLRDLHGHEPDWKLECLHEFYKKVHRVNVKLADRMRAVPGGDASVNSLVSLDVLAAMVELSLDDTSKKLIPLFASFFESV